MVPDLLVIGAGVFGLSTALAAHRAGLRVRVLEAAHPGAGSSGGIVGALTPHAPTRWRPMMAFQFAALEALPAHAAQLQELTGVNPGYARPGRIVPLTSERARARAEADAAAAPAVWGAGRMQIIDRAPGSAGQIVPGIAPYGFLWDSVSALISPRAYLAALAAALPADTIETGDVTAIHPGQRVETKSGPVAAGQIVVAAGWRGWGLVPDWLRGRGVKGQAALLELDLGETPVITHDGLYLIPHGNGTLAVGSTSEKQWSVAAPDRALDDLLLRAAEVLPAIPSARVLERWAGVRPKPPGREPVVGPIPGMPGVWIAGGGFRIGFGIAHAVGDALAAMITGSTPAIEVPESFLPRANLQE